MISEVNVRLLIANGRVYHFRHGVKVMCEEGPYWFISMVDLPVSGHGETGHDAWEDLADSFDYQYRGLVEVPRSCIYPGSLAEVDRLRDAVVRIEEEGDV